MNFFWGNIIGFISKAITMMCQLLMIKLITMHSGENVYAVWIVCSSFTAWFSLSDIGLSFSVQNKIAENGVIKVNSQHLKKHTAISLLHNLFFLCVVSLFAYPFFYHLIDKVSAEINNESIMIYLGVILSGYCMGGAAIQTKIWMAEGKKFCSQMTLPILTSVALVIGYIYEISISQLTLVNDIYLLMLTPVFMVCIYFFVTNLKGVKIKELLVESWYSKINNDGYRFFLMSITAACVIQLDVIIASAYLSATEVIKIGFIMKLITIVISALTVSLNNVGPQVTALWKTADFNKIIIIIKRLCLLWCFFVVIFITMLSLSIELLSQKLLNGTRITLNGAELTIILSYLLLRVISDVFTMVLISKTDIKIFAILIPCQAVISIPAQIMLAKEFGYIGIISGIALSFLLVNVMVLPLFVKKRLVS